MKKIYNKSGFTLLELLISVSLAVILIGAAVSIFISSSNIISISESRLDIYQNATAAFEAMANDLLNAPNETDRTFVIRNPDSDEDLQVVLHFSSTTSWLDSNSNEAKVVNGKVQVYYYLKKKSLNRWILKRQLADPFPTGEPLVLDQDHPLVHTYDVVCEFIKAHDDVPGIQVDYFQYNETNDEWDLFVPSQGEEKSFGLSEDPPLPLPPGIRVTINMSDDTEAEKNREVRTFSRYFLINENSQ